MRAAEAWPSSAGDRDSRRLDLAAQGATDQFGEANLLAPRFGGQNFLDLSREAERHRDTAFRQFRSGHEAMCIIVSYTLSN